MKERSDTISAVPPRLGALARGPASAFLSGPTPHFT